MKYMLLIYSNEKSWTKEEWTQCTVESTKVCHELAAEGKFLAASPLHPVAMATSVRVREGKRLITDGPFAETTEQLGGYYVIDVANLDEAISIASRLPPAKKGTVEIRPIYELPGLPTADDCEIFSQREFPYSRDAVFQAIEHADRLSRWWGPNGFTNTFQLFDFQPGGEWKFVMHGPDGQNYDNHSRFESITKPERVVINHLSLPNFTLTISLDETAATATHMQWRMRFASSELRNRIAKFAVDANEQNFDRLAAELARIS